jgi:DNA-binding transcriptional ArsR family regulator
MLNHMVQYGRSNDHAFTALADPTRRGILELLGRQEASITDLAERFDMTLSGVRKHVRLLEEAGLVRSTKVGRVRTCRLGPQRLEDELDWIQRYRQQLASRLDHLEAFLDRSKGEP